MNKQGIWFLTLFSLILVLSVYYISMPNELLKQNNSAIDMTFDEVNTSSKNEDDDIENINVKIESSNSILTLKVSHEEEILEEINKLESSMLLETTTADEKNNAYEQIKYLTNLQGTEEKMEELIRNTYKMDNFVEIDNSTIKIVAACNNHDVNLARKIMETVQQQFDEKKYITVRFN